MNTIDPKPTFDPVAIRKAVAEFTPRRPPKFHDLDPAKDVIIELRQKRASYRAIAALLTQHCLHTSKSAIAQYCHEVLGERVRPKRRTSAKRPAGQPGANNGDAGETQPGLGQATSEQLTESPAGESKNVRPRGPRIAQVRMLNPTGT